MKAFVVAALALSMPLSAPAEPLVLSGQTMGTGFVITLATASPEADVERIAARVEAALEEVNATMSNWDPDSELSRFNRSQDTDWQASSPALARVVSEALRIASLSNGAFDPTVLPLVDLWGFGPGQPSPARVPEPGAIIDALARVGSAKIAARGEPAAVRKLDPRASLDLSGIAKGYGIDRVAEILELEGIRDYLVDIGGDLRAGGGNPAGGPWRIAVEQPAAAPPQLAVTIEIGNASVATSGTYRSFFEYDGVQYSHIIDPRSGYPVQHRLASVTVVADTAMAADAWATALLALGPEEGFTLATAQGLAAMLIEIQAGGLRLRMTDAFDRYRVSGSEDES